MQIQDVKAGTPWKLTVNGKTIYAIGDPEHEQFVAWNETIDICDPYITSAVQIAPDAEFTLEIEDNA